MGKGAGGAGAAIVILLISWLIAELLGIGPLSN